MNVRYEDIAPSVDRFGIEEIEMAAMLTKSTCWAYEQEVRLIKQSGNMLFDIPREMIREVVFGVNMPSQRINEIIEAVTVAGIPAEFSRMEVVSEGYGVKPVWHTI